MKTGKVPAKNLNNFFVGIFIVNLAIITILFFVFRQLPERIPVWWGAAEGEGQLGPNWAIVVPILFSTTILGVNFLASKLLKEDFESKVLIVASTLATIMTFVSVAMTVSLVGPW